MNVRASTPSATAAVALPLPRRTLLIAPYVAFTQRWPRLTPTPTLISRPVDLTPWMTMSGRSVRARASLHGSRLVLIVAFRVHSVLEKSSKMLEFGIKTSRPLKVLENR